MLRIIVRRCAVLFVACCLSVGQCDPKANVWRRSLQKELLLNSIQYLRRQLFACLKATETNRGKRKVADDWYPELRLQIDLDILRNSEEYLVNRVIQCRMRLTSGSLPESRGIGLDQVLSVKPDDNQKVQAKVQKSRIADIQNSMDTSSIVVDVPQQPPGYQHGDRMPSGFNSVKTSSGYGTVPGGHKQGTTKVFSGYDAGPLPTHSSVRISPNLSGYETEITVAEFSAEKIQTKYKIDKYPSTTPSVNNPVTENTAKYETTTERKETTTHKPEASFLLDGQYITCDRVYVISNTFRCRNLRVSGDMRLPNLDYCPPHYDSNRWRSMDDMSDRTRDSLDLLDLCATIGQHLSVLGYTRHVRVVWGCDKVTPRMKWQNGKWSGVIKDNGFLHDLECTYSTEINNEI